MKKPIPKIRVFGQRSIAPLFLNRNSIPVEEDSSSKKECASFSEFLDSKLNKSVLFKPQNVEKLIPEQQGPRLFTSLVSSKDEKKIRDGGLEKTMLRQFKPREIQISEELMSRDVVTGRALEPLDQATVEEVDLLTTCFTEINDDDDDIIVMKDDKLSKKRKDPFEGMENMYRTRKPVLVFGGNLKSNQEEGERGGSISSTSCKKQKPTYNHYANGSGFWDCDMEGVDSEEVGHSEVWEGVGSTTFGDIVDWH